MTGGGQFCREKSVVDVLSHRAGARRTCETGSADLIVALREKDAEEESDGRQRK